ncbi:MAG: hypothetical protein ABIO71_02570 [Caldimonas sp.]
MLNDPAPANPPAGLTAHAFSSLLLAVSGLRNRRALIALLGCLVTGVLVSGLLVTLSPMLGFMAGFLAAVIYLLALGTGINAAGLLLMDQARGIAPRSVVDALVHGLMCIPKLIVLALALLAVEVAVFVLIAIVLFICRIPFVGPLLFVVAFPLSVVVAGLTLWGAFLCMVLSLPAIWQGATITRALAQTLAIARSRLIEAVLLLLALGFLALAVGLIISGLLFGGLVPTLGMSAGILGFGGMGAMGEMGGMGAMMPGLRGAGTGHAMAGAIGFGVLWAVAFSLVGLVYLLGLSLVYLRLTEGLDLTATESALRASFKEARRRTAELGERARAATRGSDRTDSPAPPAPPAGPDREALRAAAFGDTTMSTPLPSIPRPPGGESSTGRRPADPLPTVPTLPLTHADIDLPIDEPSPTAASFYVPPVDPTASALPPPAPAPQLPARTACPQCLSAVGANDVFCGVCGHRLK